MKQHGEKFTALSTAAKKIISEISIEQFYERLNSDKKIFLIDVREAHEYSKDKLPHAIHLSKGIIERDIEKTIPDPNAEIVLYCGGGHRSALACVNLQKMGYKNVHSLMGGYSEWINKGLPVEN